MKVEVKVRKTTGVFSDAAPTDAHPSTGAVRMTSASGILSPSPDTAYFWTEEWQRGEREADEDIRAGRLSPVFTRAEALKHLREL